MAVEADAGAEGKVGTNAHEHPAEVLVLEVEVVLRYEAVLVIYVIALSGFTYGYAGVLAALEDHGDAVLTALVLV